MCRHCSTPPKRLCGPTFRDGPRWTGTPSFQRWAGVYSSFLLHAERAAQRYGVAAHELLRRCGELELVGGQEDMIIDVAIEMAAAPAGV